MFSPAGAADAPRLLLLLQWLPLAVAVAVAGAADAPRLLLWLPLAVPVAVAVGGVSAAGPAACPLPAVALVCGRYSR